MSTNKIIAGVAALHCVCAMQMNNSTPKDTVLPAVIRTASTEVADQDVRFQTQNTLRKGLGFRF